jgi:tetratricopeptide (TPR) repeat protein
MNRVPTLKLWCGSALAALAVLAGGVGLAAAEAPRRPSAPAVDVDRLALAAVLLRDGHPERAAGVLAEIDETDPAVAETLDWARLRTLQGLAALQLRRYPEARDRLADAVGRPGVDPVTRVYLAQAHAALGDHAAALATAAQVLADASLPAATRRDTWLLVAQSRRAQKDNVGAFAAVDAAAALGVEPGTGAQAVARLRFAILVDLGLYQAAAEFADGFGTPDSADPDWTDATLAVAAGLLKAGDATAAAARLESALLQRPTDERLRVLLSEAYAALGLPVAAASQMGVVAMRVPARLADAAELERRAGRMGRALQHSAGVLDPVARVRTRLGLALDQGRFAAAIALAPKVTTVGLDRDDRVRYGLAYAYFRAGDTVAARRWLTGIADGTVYEAAIQLRAAIERAAPTHGDAQ